MNVYKASYHTNSNQISTASYMLDTMETTMETTLASVWPQYNSSLSMPLLKCDNVIKIPNHHTLMLPCVNYNNDQLMW